MARRDFRTARRARSGYTAPLACRGGRSPKSQTMKLTLLLLPLTVLSLSACGDSGGDADATDTATTGTTDTGGDDVTAIDTATTATDTGSPDTTEVADSDDPDTIPIDTDEPDTTPVDTDEPDTTPVDTDDPDTTPIDTDEPDTTPVDTDEPDTTPEDTTPVDTEETEVTPVDPCVDEPDLPLDFETLTGFTGSEDFAFNGQWAYSVDANGNLVRDNHSGQGQMVLPNLSTFAAGMALLPDGRLAVNDAASGALVIVTITPAPGSQVTKQTILGGLAYPNGIDVDQEGRVYIAEQDAGRVRRVDPITGEDAIIATGMSNPNGVSFAPGYRRLYVGSFGAGVVYAINRNPDETWSAPFVYLALPGFGNDANAINTCKGGAPGDPCYTTDGSGGHCGDVLISGQYQCLPETGFDPLVDACDRLVENDTCRIKLSGVPYGGTCTSSFGTLTCDIDQSLSAPCFHAFAGKSCLSFQFGAPFFGTCTDAASIPPELGYPPTGLFCIENQSGQGGGLDGLNVDACGTVYVTEYILGRVWRKKIGGQAEVAVELPAQWIPNMHWGSGLGGWDDSMLFVADRDEGRMFGLSIGRKGKHTVAQ